MNMQYTKHENISLRDQPGFSETWLHDVICDDVAMLGLGELDVRDRERAQIHGGRLDILLADTENDIRYEVEIMLGATDPSHIVRCIEYWDIERRRYPFYKHVAVLVAEEVTSRFLNVMSLLSGTIPMVAIQISALKVGGQLVLNFVKVLDQRDLREDDTAEGGGLEVNRQWWESRTSVNSMSICDQVLAIANEKATSPLVLRYKKSKVAICNPGSHLNAIPVWPKKDNVSFGTRYASADKWIERLKADDVEAGPWGTNKLWFCLGFGDLEKHEPILRELIHEAVSEYES